MTRTMYDAVNTFVGAIPANAEMVAGYIAPSPFAWSDADWARFPNAVHVRIAVRSATNDGHVLDVERSDAVPAQAPGWVAMRRAAGADPSVYCSASLWPTVQQQFAAQGIEQPHYWIASYPGGGAVIPPGAVAHQYRSTPNYDVSIVADYWPGVDGAQNMPLDPTNPNDATVIAGAESCLPGIAGQRTAGDLFLLSYNTQLMIAQLGQQITALSTDLSADESALLAAIKAQPTGGQVDVQAVAAALAPLLAPLLPPDATPEQIGAAVGQALAAALTKGSSA